YNVKFETTLDEQELMELLAYDQDWIESERASLLAMEDAVKHAKAILQERSKLLATHTQQRLSESTLEELTTLRFEVKESLETLRGQSNEIGFRMKEDRD